MYLDILDQTKGTLKIILYLDKNKDEKPEISRIIDELSIPRQSCYTALQNLEDTGLIVSSREKGRPPKVYCKLTQKGLKIAKCLREVDDTLGTTIEGYLRQLNKLKQKDISKKKYEEEMLYFLRNLERECYNVGKWDDAIRYGKEIARICLKFRDFEGQAEALRRIGRIHERRQEFGKALSNFEKSIKIGNMIKDYKGLASDYYYRGNILESKEQYSRALELFRKSEEYAEKGGFNIEKGRAFLGIGRILAKKGSFKESVKIMKRALNIFERNGEINELLKTYTSLGATEYYINLDEAIKWHEKCVELSEKEGNTRMLGYSLSNAVGCYIKKNDFEKAKKYLDRALPIFEKLNDKVMISSIFIHNARIYRLKELWRESKYNLDKAMKIVKSLKIPSKIADINFHYGLLHKDRENWKKAKRYLNQAKKGYKDLGNKDLVKNVEKELEGITAP